MDNGLLGRVVHTQVIRTQGQHDYLDVTLKEGNELFSSKVGITELRRIMVKQLRGQIDGLTLDVVAIKLLNKIVSVLDAQPATDHVKFEMVRLGRWYPHYGNYSGYHKETV